MHKICFQTGVRCTSAWMALSSHACARIWIGRICTPDTLTLQSIAQNLFPNRCTRKSVFGMCVAMSCHAWFRMSRLTCRFMTQSIAHNSIWPSPDRYKQPFTCLALFLTCFIQDKIFQYTSPSSTDEDQHEQTCDVADLASQRQRLLKALRTSIVKTASAV